MLRIMIADDEMLQRRYLRMVLSGNSEYQVVAEAVNGEEALAMAELNKPDVIFMDIRMPGYNGLEVSRRVREMLPNTRIIIVSAYSEFHYAQQAVGIGTTEYLLKPVSEDDVLKLMAKIAKEIEEENRQRKEFEEAKELLKDSLPLIKTGYVMDLINGGIEDIEEMRVRGSLLGLTAPIRLGLCVGIDEVSLQHNIHSELENQILQRKVILALNDALKDWPQSLNVVMGNGVYVVLLAAERDIDDDTLKTMGLEQAEKICAAVRDNTTATVTVGVGRSGTLPLEIARSYREASVAREYCIMYGGDQPLHADDVDVVGEYQNIVKQNFENNITTAISTGDLDRTLRLFFAWWAEYVDNEKKISAVRSKINELCASITKQAENGGADKGELEDMKELLAETIAKENDVAQMKEEVLVWLNNVVGHIRTSKEFRNVNLIDKAIQYMEENYAKEISLEDVAKRVFLSTCYFSRLFKQVKGWSFTEYLTNIRIEEARKLLISTTDSVSDISKNVGFRDARYFSQVFKNHIGKTPGAYRREESIRIISMQDK